MDFTPPRPPDISQYGMARRIVNVVFGFLVLAFGAALLVLPGPGIPFVIFALVILSAEFVWARRLLRRVYKEGMRVRDAILPRRKPKPPTG